MLKLDTVEQSWLNDYRQALDSNFPDLVEDIVIFGSKPVATPVQIAT